MTGENRWEIVRITLSKRRATRCRGGVGGGTVGVAAPVLSPFKQRRCLPLETRHPSPTTLSRDRHLIRHAL